MNKRLRDKYAAKLLFAKAILMNLITFIVGCVIMVNMTMSFINDELELNWQHGCVFLLAAVLMINPKVISESYNRILDGLLKLKNILPKK